MKQNKVPKIEYSGKEPSSKRSNPYKHDVIYSNLGQWKYPGQVTRIPSNQITMQGVPYPVQGIDDTGYSQMMYPGMDYTFPGQYVTEYPMANAMYGGDPSLNNIEGHYPFGGQNTKTHTHMKGGGSLNRKVTCSNCGWSWRLSDGGTDPMTCHKCGGTIKMENGGWLDKYQDAGPVSPYKPSTIEEYNFRNKMYNDSLALANQSRKINWTFPKNPNITKEEYDKLRELEDSYPQYQFLKEQYDIDKKKKTVGEFKDYIQQYYLTNSISNNGVISTLKDDEKTSITGKDLSEGIDSMNKKYEEARNKYSKEWVDKKGLNYSFQPDGDDDKSGILYIDDPQTGTRITKFVYKDSPEYNSTIDISNKYIKPTETLYKGSKNKKIRNNISLSSSSTGWYDSTKSKPKFKDTSNDSYIGYDHEAEFRDLYPFPKQKILKPDKDAPKGEELTMELFLKEKEKKKKEKEEKEKEENEKKKKKEPKKQALPTGVKRQWNFNGPNPVLEEYDKAGKLTGKEYYDKNGKKINPYIPQYGTAQPVVNKKDGGWLDKMQEGGNIDISKVRMDFYPKSQIEAEVKIKKGLINTKRKVDKNGDDEGENLFEIFDPTGISSWNDVKNEYKRTGISPETTLEVLGAIPMLGKVAKLLKNAPKAFKGIQGYEKINQNRHLIGDLLNNASKAGRVSDGYQYLDSDYDAYKRGGQKGLKHFTSKNIQSSVNDIMMRNETLFGPAGKRRYKPGLKYKHGGNWLDNLH